MRKLWCLAIIVLIAACALVFLFPGLAYVPLGRLNHEAFFNGKPTSYWTRAVQGEGFLGQAPPKMDVGQALRDGGKESVGVLTQMLQDPDRNVRRQAMLAVFYIGAEAKPAAPVLAEMMKREENSVVFMAASAALAKADPELECETLAVVLRNPSNRDCRACALAVLLDKAASLQCCASCILL